MSAAAAAAVTDTSTTLIVHRDNYADNDNDTTVITASASSPNNEIVLDALSYVEPLDPNYEQYALSLVEAEMQQQYQQQQQQQVAMTDDDNIDVHPTLRRSIGALSESNNNFAKRAPLAAAAYEALVQKKRRQQQHPSNADGVVEHDADAISTGEKDNDDNTTKNIIITSSSSIDDLQTAIKQSKIQFEHQRLRYTNLELHSLFETPQKYTSYLSSLEKFYTVPTATAVEQQRLVVDGINGTRMEEQSACMNKLMGLQMKYGMLMDKNWKLGNALENLQMEVDGLEKQVVSGDE
ncbi:hypothetical protein ACHAWU_003154 [Discostella pseudostelligera]|uniref:Uncharacterized protein n=1 Tax=Discostella pseudostelligera TaxID=259834 RepID=A0ABD3M5I1_9STRA